MFVGRPPVEGFARDRIGQPCTEFDEATKSCRIYESRPQVCRDFKIGGISCKNYRERVGLSTP